MRPSQDMGSSAKRHALPHGVLMLFVVSTACGAPPPGSSEGALSAASPSRSDVKEAPVVPSSSSAPTAPIAAPSATDPRRKIGARHVLIQWMGSERAGSSIVRSREQALALAEDILRRARNKEDFARLAVEFSDEPGAASRGGSLGRFGRGQMVPAFEAAAFKLEVGQVSEIVETGFGFHIIQRTE